MSNDRPIWKTLHVRLTDVLRDTPFLPLIALVLGCVATWFISLPAASALITATPWREIVLQQVGPDPGGNFWGIANPFLRQRFGILLLWLVPAVLIWMLRTGNVMALATACASLYLYWLWGSLFDHFATGSTSLGEAPTPGAYLVKLLLVGLTLLSPPFIVFLYRKASILDRYVIWSFATPFFLCLLGFLAIWLVIDLGDNGPDFIEAENPVGFNTIALFYITRIPQVIVLILDVTLLLSMLYTLGKMSRANEIISMLGAGISLQRILLPLFLTGIYASLVSLTLNYEWAPKAERQKDHILQTLDDDDNDKQTFAKTVLYRNRPDNRTWFVSLIPIDLSEKNKMRSVEVYQQDEDGHVVKSWAAKTAYWIPGSWRFFKCQVSEYDSRGIPLSSEFHDKLYVEHWSETPWNIQSGSIKAEFLGVQELRSYLSTNTHLPVKKLAPFRTQLSYRWALPWRCLIVILVAAPLGIVFSRRGLLGGVASSVFIYFTMFFLSAVFLALGEGLQLPPVAAAWITNLLFGLIGLGLLIFRSRNREIPKLALPKIFPKTSS